LISDFPPLFDFNGVQEGSAPFRMFDFSQLLIFNGVQEGVAISDLFASRKSEHRLLKCFETQKRISNPQPLFRPIILIVEYSSYFSRKFNFMKQKVLAFLILFVAGIGTALAQPAKGQFYMGGNVVYNYNSYGSSNTITYSTGYTIYNITNVAAFSLSPEIGYFISNKWSIGIQPTYQRTSGTETSYFYSNISAANNSITSDNYHNDIAGLAVDVRYHCMITDKFGFFPQLGIGTLNNTTYFKYGTFTIGATPNFIFFPNPRLGVILGFGSIAYNVDYQTKDKTFNIGLNNSIAFGLNYYWGKK
jgi:hypothetical protein